MFKCSESSSDSEDEKEVLIERTAVVDSQIGIDHLICSICHHVVWDPVTCGYLEGCHSTFCNTCIDKWVHRAKSQRIEESCPNCKSPFIKSQVAPIMKSILESMKIKCLYSQDGCEQILGYSEMSAHMKKCRYRLKRCSGCRLFVPLLLYEGHTNNCEKYLVVCERCLQEMPKAQYMASHFAQRSIECFQNQIEGFGDRASDLEQNLLELKSRTMKLQSITNCFLSGEALQLYISFYTTFSQHFVFPNPTLVKPSFNEAKQRFDFLHFYVNNPISISSIVSMKWAIRVGRMSGNILLGFCSNMSINSLDYIVNKFGELKRKDVHDNKYKIVRKNDFAFGQGDVIRCRYTSLMRRIHIENETRKQEMMLSAAEVEEFLEGEKIYIFFSMDTLHDSISFIS